MRTFSVRVGLVAALLTGSLIASAQVAAPQPGAPPAAAPNGAPPAFPPRAPLDPRVQQRTYTFKDTNEVLPYAVFVSSKVTKDKKNPLIIALHGLGGDQNTMMRVGAIQAAEEGGYILVGADGLQLLGLVRRAGDDGRWHRWRQWRRRHGWPAARWSQGVLPAAHHAVVPAVRRRGAPHTDHAGRLERGQSAQ